MYFSRFFFLAFEFFAWKIVILKEWKKFITIRKWPSIAPRKKIRSWISESFPWHIVTSQYMEHVWWRKWWRRVNIKWFYLVFWKYLFCHIQIVEWKGETYQYWLCCDCWILCVIPHIREDAFKNAQNKHNIQVNNIIKTLFAVSTEKELHGTLVTFWKKYTKFNQKNDSFDSNAFICNSKYITDGNSHLWHHKYSLPSNKFLGIVAYRVTSKILGIWSAERSWGDVKTIQSEKRSSL